MFLKIFFALGPIEYIWIPNTSTWTIDEILESTASSVQSGLGSNINEGVLYTQQISRSGTSPLDAV